MPRSAARFQISRPYLPFLENHTIECPRALLSCRYSAGTPINTPDTFRDQYSIMLWYRLPARVGFGRNSGPWRRIIQIWAGASLLRILAPKPFAFLSTKFCVNNVHSKLWHLQLMMSYESLFFVRCSVVELGDSRFSRHQPESQGSNSKQTTFANRKV